MTEKEQFLNMYALNKYPEYLKKYEETKTLKRLDGVGQFCGCDYTGIFKPRFWFTDLDHSKNTAAITSRFTKDKAAVITALHHDVGTPAFNHCVDFLLNDFLKQEKSEKSIKSIIKKDEETLEYLNQDGLSVEDICDPSKYSIVENKSPKLCADRLDGVLHTGFVWLDKYSLEEIKKIYDKMFLLKEARDVDVEVGFLKKEDAEAFFRIMYDYSIILQSNEDQYVMRYIAACLKQLITKKIITFEHLYILSEAEIIKLFEVYIPDWFEFVNKTYLTKSPTYRDGFYQRLDVKKRFTNPLCVVDNRITRVDQASKEVRTLIKKYNNFEDSKYYK